MTCHSTKPLIFLGLFCCYISHENFSQTYREYHVFATDCGRVSRCTRQPPVYLIVGAVALCSSTLSSNRSTRLASLLLEFQSHVQRLLHREASSVLGYIRPLTLMHTSAAFSFASFTGARPRCHLVLAVLTEPYEEGRTGCFWRPCHG